MFKFDLNLNMVDTESYDLLGIVLDLRTKTFSE